MSSRDLIRKQDGVILVIIPVVMILLGLVIAYMTRSVQAPDFYKEELTARRMNEVMAVMSTYVQRYNRLPCPAQPSGAGPEPFGFEIGATATGAAVPATCGAWREGILPYKTLGLPQEYARDSWGRYFTYAISPAFAVDPIVDRYPANPALALNDRLPRASATANMAVHAACRRNPAWIEGGRTGFTDKAGVAHTFGGTFAVARNPWKARFCCAGLAPYNDTTDLIINVNGTPTAARNNTAGNYATADVATGAAGGNIEVPVVALISHGQNAYGAYLVNGTNNKSPLPGTSISPEEIENANGAPTSVTAASRTYFQGPRRYLDISTTYFDDIVTFRTQNSLYGETGRGSCNDPYL